MFLFTFFLFPFNDATFYSFDIFAVPADSFSRIAQFGSVVFVEDELYAEKAAINSSIQEIDNETKFHQEILQERLVEMSDKVATIKMDAYTETELNNQTNVILDATQTVRVALDEGIIPGVGVAIAVYFPDFNISGYEVRFCHSFFGCKDLHKNTTFSLHRPLALLSRCVL